VKKISKLLRPSTVRFRSKKRPAIGKIVKSPRKRQKKFSFLDIGEEINTQPKQQEIVKAIAKETVQEPVKAIVGETCKDYQERVKDQVFRFMDLPGGWSAVESHILHTINLT
jgi:hypothetical protein